MPAPLKVFAGTICLFAAVACVRPTPIASLTDPAGYAILYRPLGHGSHTSAGDTLREIRWYAIPKRTSLAADSIAGASRQLDWAGRCSRAWSAREVYVVELQQQAGSDEGCDQPGSTAYFLITPGGIVVAELDEALGPVFSAGSPILQEPHD